MSMYPTIIVVAYNRPNSLSRILGSINAANYFEYDNIRLIISIDGGGDRHNEVVSIAQSFDWMSGEKEIIINETNLGLRNHVIACGDLTLKYDNVIVLEEDCFVSKNYYEYAINALSYYKTDNKIAGISLYAYHYYESIGALFNPMNDGYDTYFMQVPSSWGQIWTKTQWQAFKNYYNSSPKILDVDKIPERVKAWPESSWKKYFYKYMVEKDLYFVYPHVAYSTNFGDIGVHYILDTHVNQVAVENYMIGSVNRFSSFSTSNNKYDAFFELLPDCLISLGVDVDKDTCIDILGSKSLLLFNNKYLLSSKRCVHPIRSYDNVMIPIVQNIVYGIEGTALHYGLINDFGDLDESSRVDQISKIQSIGFHTGRIQVISSKYYKLGFYLLNLDEFLKMLRRKARKLFH